MEEEILDIAKYNDELDDDELDILALVSTDANKTDQYLIFEGSDDEFYAINVSKIKELLVYKELNKIKYNQKDNPYIKYLADIRGDMISLVCFDEWFGNKVLDDNEYELVIYVGFGGYDFGIIVKRVEYIVNIEPNSTQNNSISDSKISFISKIKLNGKDRLCTVFDSDKMLLDIFSDMNEKIVLDNISSKKELDKSKYILFADDSGFIRNLIGSMLEKLEFKAKIYENGKMLLDELKQMDPSEIGLIITDLEMPVMDGVTLIKNIQNLEFYKNINIIVHTNMSNDIMSDSLIKLGAKKIISKVDLDSLSKYIEEYFN